MFKPDLFKSNQTLRILCLGSHPDDIEIGCGGTILKIVHDVPETEFNWVIFSGKDERHEEARKSAELFLKGAKSKKIELHKFKDSYFPFIGGEIKNAFETLKTQLSPDIIFTHRKNDAHQDHRLLSELTWNTFRNHLIFEYEIPKFDGDLRTPNFYVSLDESLVRKKVDFIFKTFESQKSKQWFSEDTFKAIMRLRGVESNSASGYAEGFLCRKLVV